ncbi:MAG: ATP-binding protein [Caulobacterales bacterium]
MTSRIFDRSLAGRLVVTAAAWCLVVLLAGGWALSQLYRSSVERQLDGELRVVLDTLLSTIEPRAGGVVLPVEPNDPRFAQTFSGRYWQINLLGADGKAAPALRATSLWDEALSWPVAQQGPGRAGEIQFAAARGPKGQKLRLAQTTFEVQGVDRRVQFLAAADRTNVDADADRFTATLFASLALLALGLIAAVVIQVRIGLAPLAALQGDIADVRRGRKPRLDGDYPTEVAPLTGELNSLLDHNRDIVERARTHVGNLAHALKTPISVLLNEARAAPGPLGDLVARQAEAMAANIDHYLKRAQAAARAEMIGVRTPVRPALEDIARTLERLYGRRKDLDLTLHEGPALFFRGERQDFDDMAGNLIENACKYGRGKVDISIAAGADGASLVLTVADDGPGLSAADRAEALKRGARLDETLPGQGLGLSIVAETARLYGGALDLGDSALGGLRAQLTLPAAD